MKCEWSQGRAPFVAEWTTLVPSVRRLVSTQQLLLMDRALTCGHPRPCGRRVLGRLIPGPQHAGTGFSCRYRSRHGEIRKPRRALQLGCPSKYGRRTGASGQPSTAMDGGEIRFRDRSHMTQYGKCHFGRPALAVSIAGPPCRHRPPTPAVWRLHRPKPVRLAYQPN